MRTPLKIKPRFNACYEDLDLDLDNVSSESVEKLIANHEAAHNDYEDDVSDFEDITEAIDEANTVKDELEEKVIALEALNVSDVNYYIINDAKNTYFKACRKIGIATSTAVSSEDYDTNIQLSIEGIKEVIDTLVKTIKEVIDKIINFVKNLYIKFQVAFNNDNAVAKKLHTEITEVYNKNSNGQTKFKSHSFMGFLAGRTKGSMYYKHLAGISAINVKARGTVSLLEILTHYVEYGKKFSHVSFGNIKNGDNLVDYLEGFYSVDSHSGSLVGGIFDINFDSKNDAKNDAMLEQFVVTALKGNKIYGFNIYKSDASSIDNAFSFNEHAKYEVNTLKGLTGGEQTLFFTKSITNIKYSEVLAISALVVKSTEDIKAIKSQFDKMVEEAKKAADKLANEIKNDPTMSKVELNNVKSMSLAFSRMYTDKMLSYLYLNKVMISLLKDSLADMK